MVKPKLILYARGGQVKLYPLLANKLSLDYEYCYVVQNKEEEKIVESIDLNPNKQIYNLEIFLKDNWNNESNIDLKSVEEKYRIDSLWTMFYMDRFLVNYSCSDAKKMIKLHIDFSEQIFKKEKPDFFINEEVALFFPKLISKIGGFYSCKYVGFSVPRNYSKSKVLFKDEEGEYAELNEIYIKKDINSKDLSAAYEEVRELIEAKVKPSYMINTGVKPVFKFKYILHVFKYLLLCLKPINKQDYVNLNKHKSYLEGITFYIRQLRQKRYFTLPSLKEKYILYPLHYTPEASTLVNAPFYEKQTIIIDFLAKSIPSDTVLYVKEHYAKIGHKPSHFYENIKKKYPNVILIDPWSDSFSLIEKACALVVLTSTAGWEALMMRKKVLILGDVFYARFKYATKINTISSKTLPNDIKIILESKINKEVYDKEFSLFFASYKKAMHEGNYYLGYDDVLTDTNVTNLSKALKDYIKDLYLKI